jgi:hypothetical protein
MERKNDINEATLRDTAKLLFPAGTAIVLDYMDDPQPIPEGTRGVVKFVDDAGQIHVKWENGSSLAVIPGLDRFHSA